MSDQPPKLVSLPETQSALRAAVAATTRELDVILQNQTNLAKIRRALYLALVAEGFSEQQALELCVK